MIDNVRRRLMLFCLSITGIIFLLFSVICLLITEKNIKQNNNMIFQNQLHSILSYLEQQDTVSLDWISVTENNKQVLVDIETAGQTLIYSTLAHTSEEQELIAYTRTLNAANDSLNAGTSTWSSVSQKTEFQVDYKQNRYLAASLSVPKKTGMMNAVVLYTLQSQKEIIRGYRLLFLTLDLTVLCILAVFAYFFTRKTLQPVEESRRRQTAFIAAASHELRTPLMVILTNAEAMDEHDLTQVRKCRQMISSESRRMSHLVDDLLTLARTDNQPDALHIGAAAPDTLVVSLYEKYEPLARKNQIRLSFSLPEDLMEEYPCDPEKLEQAIGILLSNALCYTPAGGLVRITVAQTSKALTFQIADNGPGIPDSEKETIFQRFQRGSSAAVKEEHFGLGLAIARELIQKHKGKLYVTDTPGGGATFIISLPMRKKTPTI